MYIYIYICNTYIYICFKGFDQNPCSSHPFPLSSPGNRRVRSRSPRQNRSTSMQRWAIWPNGWNLPRSVLVLDSLRVCLVGIKRIIPQGAVTCSETPIKTIQAKMLPLKEIVVLSFYQQCFPLHFNYLVWVTSTSATSISESTNGDVVHLHQLPGL